MRKIAQMNEISGQGMDSIQENIAATVRDDLMSESNSLSLALPRVLNLRSMWWQ